MKLSKAAREEFRRVGKTGGQTRAKNLTKARRVAIAKLGAARRWGKKIPPAEKIA